MLLSLTRNPSVPLRLRKKIGKFLKLRAGQRFEMPIFECMYHGTSGIHMDDKIWVYGMHESATVRLLRDILKRQRARGTKPVYLDIGTNKGMHLIAVAPLADQALGFEPWSEVRQMAEKNITQNMMDHVWVMPFGLSDENAELSFIPPSNNNLGVGYFSENEPSTIILPVHIGDDVVNEHNITPTLLKIDVEGFEHKVLRGLKNTITAHKPVIVFEYSDGSRDTLGPLEKRMELFGPDYVFFGIARSREYPKLVPFKHDGKYENVLALPKTYAVEDFA